MTDPTDMMLMGGGGAGIGALLVGLVKGLGARNLSSLDETLKSLRGAVEELHKEVRHLRETDLAQGIHIGALQQEVKGLKERVDGQGEYWHKQFEALRNKRQPK